MNDRVRASCASIFTLAAILGGSTPYAHSQQLDQPVQLRLVAAAPRLVAAETEVEPVEEPVQEPVQEPLLPVAPVEEIHVEPHWYPEMEYADAEYSYGDCDTCDGSGCDTCCLWPTLPSGWFFGGAEYLHVRPSFSEAKAFVARDFNTFTDSFVEYDFGYGDSLRAFGGYRLCDCDTEVTFTYTNVTSIAAEESDQIEQNLSNQFIGPAEIVALLPGESLEATAGVDLSTYDVDFTKTFPFGQQAPSCDFESACCPSWDLAFSCGVRIADVDWSRQIRLRDSDGATLSQAQTMMDFTGAGPRLGLMGRKYVGPGGCWSIYAKGNLSLLLGDYDIRTLRTRPLSNPLETQEADYTRIIPVTEMEVGTTCRFSECLTLTAGYLFHAWHDLGTTDEFPPELNVGVTYDDANILGFDGFFVRGEYAF